MWQWSLAITSQILTLIYRFSWYPSIKSSWQPRLAIKHIIFYSMKISLLMYNSIRLWFQDGLLKIKIRVKRLSTQNRNNDHSVCIIYTKIRGKSTEIFFASENHCQRFPTYRQLLPNCTQEFLVKGKLVVYIKTTLQLEDGIQQSHLSFGTCGWI